MRILVESVTGKMITFRLESSGGIENVNSSIHNTDENLCKSIGWDYCLSYHFGVSGLRISVMTYGRCFTFDVDNFLEITTQDYEVPFPNMDVVLAEMKMQMFVRTTTKQLVKVEVKSIMVDVDTVKTGIHEMEGTSPELFVKTTPKKKLQVKVTSEIIEFCVTDTVKAGIQSLDRTSPESLLSNAHLKCIFLDVKLQISVKTVTGKIITLKVKSSETSDNVNTCINTCIQPVLPRLNCDVVMLGLPIWLQRHYGRRHFKLEVKSCDTIDNVKSMMEDEFGYPAKDQQLDLCAHVLEDGRAVAYYLWDPVKKRCGSSLHRWARGDCDKETKRRAE